MHDLNLLNTTMKEDNADEYRYVVIQFLQQPYADIGDYTCVPHSWLRIRRATDRKCTVAYPDEPPLLTKMRIKKCDKPSKKWKHYMAIIKHETHSYEDAHEFIMEKSHYSSTDRNSAVMSTNNNIVPATETEQYSPLPKRTKLSEPQSKKNINKLKVDKARLDATISNSKKPPKPPNVESTLPTSSELAGHVMKENDGREQISHDVLPCYDDLILRYPHLYQILEEGKGTQVNSPGTSSQSITRKTLHASRDPLNFVNQICDQQPQGNQQLSIYRDHLHHIALTQGIPKQGIPNLRTFLLDFPKPLTRDSDIVSNTSFTIQNSINKAHQSSQLEIPNSSVNQIHSQVSPTQKTTGQSSEVECAIPKPSSHSEMANASYASVGGSNSAYHQNSSIEEIVIDESSEGSCIEQSIFSERRAENESSAVPKSLKNANLSSQSAESYMEEGPLVNDDVTPNDVSTQNVDDDERSSSSEISLEEILAASPNSNEQVDQSVYSVLNMADNWADRLIDLFQRMEVNSSHTCQIVHDMHKSLVQSHGVIESIANASKNLRKLRGETTAVTSKEVTVEDHQRAEENQAERKEEENPDLNMEEDKKKDNDDVEDLDRNIKDVKDKGRDDEVPKTTRGHIRTFVLPPEYDPDDTRWTLKYRENDPKLNLVELVPNSNVFINSIKLAHCKRMSKDAKALARMLLMEIFSQIALSVCSLTGVRANAFDISGTNVRPGLDEPARMAIMSFVAEHALKKKWAEIDSQSVTNSLRSKIQDVRAKHAKTV